MPQLLRNSFCLTSSMSQRGYCTVCSRAEVDQYRGQCAQRGKRGHPALFVKSIRLARSLQRVAEHAVVRGGGTGRGTGIQYAGYVSSAAAAIFFLRSTLWPFPDAKRYTQGRARTQDAIDWEDQ